jgi:hypothetical protein
MRAGDAPGPPARSRRNSERGVVHHGAVHHGAVHHGAVDHVAIDDGVSDDGVRLDGVISFVVRGWSDCAGARW